MSDAKATILIADDDRVARELLEAWLVSADLRVESAQNGEETLRKAAELTPDLVLLDVMMPGMDGFEVCRRLRSDPQLAEVPVMMITALNDRDSRLRGIEAGADDFVTKPYDGAELKARVKTIVRLNRYRRLVNERTKFEWVVDHSDDGYLLISAEDMVLYANPSARIYLGRTGETETSIAESFRDVALTQYHPEPQEAWESWPKPSALPRYLVRPETRNSSSFWLRVESIKIPANHGGGDGFLIRLRDETARIVLKRDMWKFNALVAHKLRTPLTVILGSFELFQKDISNISKEELVELFGMANESARRLNDQFVQILSYLDAPDLARQSGEGFELAALEDLVREITRDLDLEGLTLRADELPEGRTVLPPVAFELVLREILGNAKKFHPQESPEVEIVAEAAFAEALEDGRHPVPALRLRIQDDGAHLPAELLARVWSPYFQSEKGFSGNVAGMGLGLSVVASLVWGVGGSCRLDNREDREGIVVEIVIPTA